MRDTLAAQVELIWPFEEPLLPDEPGRLLDLACGTGEFLRRVRPRCSFAVGVDLFAGHLQFAEGPVVCGNGLQLPFADATFDTVAVRHVLQALPDPVPLLAEARRVLRPGGRLHLIAEDYQGLFFDGPDVAVENHFAEVAPLFRERGTDLFQGRRAWRHLRDAGFADVAVRPLLVDNVRGDREAFHNVFRHWGEGYAATLAELTGRPLEEMERRFAAMAENASDPVRYCGWLLFAWSGTCPS